MTRSAVAACLAGAIVVVAACSGPSRGEDAFCSRLQRDRDSLVAGVVDAKTADAAAERYAALDSLAPEAIRVEWHQVAQLVKAAADIDGASATARTDLVLQAYAAAPAAAAVTDYAKTTCGVDLAPPGAATPTVTTAPTPTTPPTSG
jgi:hypothetical protein